MMAVVIGYAYMCKLNYPPHLSLQHHTQNLNVQNKETLTHTVHIILWFPLSLSWWQFEATIGWKLVEHKGKQMKVDI